MLPLFNRTAFESSRLITKAYSTSFSLGIRTLHKRLHYPVYAIYGFVRYGDEIVDTFHDHDKATLLEDFRRDTHLAVERGISLNPVLHAFQAVVHEYKIPQELYDSFLDSMAMDLDQNKYNQAGYERYIYGSAQVVGLMCLKVFCEGDEALYEKLVPHGKSLGSAFQKVNFLRDLKSDYAERGRVYFPGVDFTQFNGDEKRAIEEDIAKDFEHAYQGIIQLPKPARLGVYLAYIYYQKLFKKIKRSSPAVLQEERLRIPDGKKITLLMSSYVKHRMGSLSRA